MKKELNIYSKSSKCRKKSKICLSVFYIFYHLIQSSSLERQTDTGTVNGKLGGLFWKTTFGFYLQYLYLKYIIIQQWNLKKYYFQAALFSASSGWNTLLARTMSKYTDPMQNTPPQNPTTPTRIPWARKINHDLQLSIFLTLKSMLCMKLSVASLFCPITSLASRQNITTTSTYMVGLLVGVSRKILKL